MPCFCKAHTTTLIGLKPTASLSVKVVPPQMMKLLTLLGLQETASGQARVDLKLDAMLPAMTPAMYMRATLAAKAPNIALPALLPSDGGGPISMMMKLTATGFPLTDPRALLTEIQQTVLSLAAHILPQAQAIPQIPAPVMQNITLAANMTLALRARGICPMALAGLDYSFEAASETKNAGGSRGACSAALHFATSLPGLTLRPFVLPLPKLNLARQLALLAPAATAPAKMGLPPISDPNLTKMLMGQLAVLSTIPAPNLPISLKELQAITDKLRDLTTIQMAFGPDALTPAGVARINAMLHYMARLNVPLPLEAQALQLQLDAVPGINAVNQGAQVAQNGALNLAASMTVQPPAIPILPTLQSLTKLTSSLPGLPPGSCNACSIDIRSIKDSLAGMRLPPAPPLPPLPALF